MPKCEIYSRKRVKTKTEICSKTENKICIYKHAFLNMIPRRFLDQLSQVYFLHQFSVDSENEHLMNEEQVDR